ncbi:MAG TPA: DUF2339 domain-containing protein [Myxococcales bacterium]|nr:DUF2339 domain-containing protein [Myxococcales bacterium]
MSDDDVRARLLALEKAVDWLQRDLAQLRTQLGREQAAPVSAPSAPPRIIEALPAPPAPRKPALDLETLVGRYGMLGIATLLALAAVGTFVSWAIAHGLLGPGPRVLLGLATAAGVGALGVRLRGRERSFGDSLLGLALAIVHVCAWQAGPSLHLVPPFAALALSAVASVALAGYALTQDDEPLWCVGFGGAAVAPFVTSTGEGTAPMLAGYAAAVLIAGGTALSSRPWGIARRVYAAAAALLTLALAAMPEPQHSAELSVALPFAAAGLGVLPVARDEFLRPRLRTLALLSALAALFATVARVEHLVAQLCAGLPLLAWLAMLELVDDEPPGMLLDGWGKSEPGVADWADGALVPLGFLVALGAAFEWDGASPAATAAAAALALSARRRSQGALRDALALPAFLCAQAAVLIALRDRHELAAAAMSGVCVLFLFLERALPNRTWRWAPLAALVATGAYALGLLTVRPSYQYVPFATAASAAALAVGAGFAVAAALLGSRAAVLAAGVFLFLWIHQELAWAVSPATSTLLLVTWYASTGVGCVGFGRARGVPQLRHAGLGLAVIAALLALKAAWGLPSTGARIGAYLVVSVFLLGIAWWYRKPGARPAAADQ